MAGKPLTAVQILARLGRIERRIARGEAPGLACKAADIGETTYRRWKKEYGGLAHKLQKAARPAAAAGAPDSQRLELAMRALNEGVYDWDIAGDSIYFSNGVYRATGTTREQGDTAQSWRNRIHPDDLPEYEAGLRRHFKGETERFECDYRFQADDGTWRWARQHGVALRDARGRAVRMVGSTGDISELKQAELDLKRSRDETAVALERQTATAEILKVIASSPSDVQPVFDAILASQMRLFDGFDATVWMVRDGRLHAVARGGPTVSVNSASSVPITPDDAFGIAILGCHPMRLDDIVATKSVPEAAKASLLARGRGSALMVPMARNGQAIGAISVSRRTPYPFSDNQLALLETFADQAVIAIENVRLFNETKESLERQTATAEILRVIASSPSDVQPVFDAIARSAKQLFGGRSGAVWRVAGETLQITAYTATDAAGNEALKNYRPIALSRPNSILARTAVSAKPVFVTDTETNSSSPEAKELARARGYRSQLAVPMVREGAVLGVIVITRSEPGTFSGLQVDLLSTFADQAVIAIENVRLFKETKESLERQTATAEILRVIASSPEDVQPVFDAIAQSAMRLLGAHSAAVFRILNDMLHLDAHTETDEAGHAALQNMYPRPLSPSVNSGKAALTGAPSFRADVESDPDISPEARAAARARGYRSNLAVPMMHDGAAIGAISITRREPGMFSDHQICSAPSPTRP